MVIVASWFVLLIGLVLFAWFFLIRARGTMRYWIRTFQIEKQWAVGQIFDGSDKVGISKFFRQLHYDIL